MLSVEKWEIETLDHVHRKMKFSRVDYVVWKLHESNRSFTQEIESLELAKSGPEHSIAVHG